MTVSLNEDLVLKVRKLYATGLYTKTVLAERFDVSISNICAITNGRTWKNV